MRQWWIRCQSCRSARYAWVLAMLERHCYFCVLLHATAQMLGRFGLAQEETLYIQCFRPLADPKLQLLVVFRT